MKQAITIAAVFVGHVALFTLAYYGRRQGVAACQSDMVVFGVPFLLAVSAYTIPLGSLFRTRAAVSRICLTGAFAVCAALLSIVTGMTVAFNLMGT